MLVIGSGAGALVTAVTAAHAGLAVTLVEKAPVLGSTTAWSGGWLWIPRNPLALAAGINEDPDEPRLPGQRDRRHRRRSAGRRLPRQRPEMLRFFEETPRSPSSMATGCPTSTRRRGRARGGRSVAARPYDGRRLGAWIDRLRPPLDVISLGGLGISSGADLYHFVNATRSLASARHVAGRFLRHGRDLARLRRSTQLVNGNALVARLVAPVPSQSPTATGHLRADRTGSTPT